MKHHGPPGPRPSPTAANPVTRLHAISGPQSWNTRLLSWTSDEEEYMSNAFRFLNRVRGEQSYSLDLEIYLQFNIYWSKFSNWNKNVIPAINRHLEIIANLVSHNWVSAYNITERWSRLIFVHPNPFCQFSTTEGLQVGVWCLPDGNPASKPPVAGCGPKTWLSSRET